ncbi:MAG TPA: MerR family transcriptional regulator [Desulfobulbus sp.]|nr:MerR family transcriptional regulator [Desulfobulbus sp.]
MKEPTPEAARIPDKKYFRIGEVSSLVGVDPHVLRYWETEFKLIRPRRARSNQRLYRRQDVENLLRIKTLLHDEGYTISGARRLLSRRERRDKRGAQEPAPQPASRLRLIRRELEAILQRLQGNRPGRGPGTAGDENGR